MSSSIDRVLTRAASRLNTYLEDTAIIARTGASIPVWVDTKKTSRTVPGLPDFVRVPQFNLTFRDRSDVLPNDIATVTNHTDSTTDSFHIVTVYKPTTFSVSTDTDALLLSVSPGGTLPITPNDSIRFKNVRTGLTLTLDAWTYRLDAEPKGAEAGAGFRWAAIFDPRALDSSGHRPTAGDLIFSTFALGNDENGNARSAAILAKPLRTFGIMPLATAYFMEPA